MDTKKTILFIETGVNGGGSFESLYQVIRNMDRKRFKPIVLYSSYTIYFQRMIDLKVETYLIKDFLYSNVLPQLLVKIFVHIGWIIGRSFPKLTPCYEWFMHFRTIYFIRKIIRKRNVDLVLLNNTILRNLFCVVGLNKMEVPILSYLRSFITKGMTYYMACYGNRRVKRYVTYSEELKELWSAVGVDKSNIEVIPNGIEIVDIKPIDIWARSGIEPRGGPLVGCVGSIRPNRSYDFLIRSFARVIKKEPGAYLVIIGSCYNDKLFKKLKNLVDDLGLVESVRFHGPDPEAKRMIGGMDVFCLPYKVEPFGRVLLEAWLAKTPIIATRKGKIEKIITDCKDGLLVGYGDERALCHLILKLWKDKDLGVSLVKRGRNTVEKRFSIEECTKKIEKLYETSIRKYDSLN